MFTYCNNQPINTYDSSGRFPVNVNVDMADSGTNDLISYPCIPIVKYDSPESQAVYDHVREFIMGANYDGIVQGISISKAGEVYEVNDASRTNDALLGIGITTAAGTAVGTGITTAVAGLSGGLAGALVGFCVGLASSILYEAIDNYTSPNLSDGLYQNYKVTVYSTGYTNAAKTEVFHCYTEYVFAVGYGTFGSTTYTLISQTVTYSFSH